MAKATKGAKGKGNKKNTGGASAGGSNEDEEEIVLPDMDELDANMERKITYLTSELGKIRSGRASADMLNFIVVDAYGDRVPITDTAQISLKTPTKLIISTFDAAITAHVATAIRECGLGFAPAVEGTVITVTVPKPSKEARESLCKVASKLGEQMKTDVRHARKQWMDKIKALKGVISEDDARRLGKEVDAVTEKKVQRISALVQEKEKAIMET